MTNPDTEGATGIRRERQKVRVEVDRLLADVDIPVPFDIEAFCQVLADRRQRRITLTPMSQLLGGQPSRFSGLWIAATSVDYLFYDDSTSRLHWENSVLHELGHMLFGHCARSELDDCHLELLRVLLPDLTADRLHTLLGRAGYTDQHERQAELFAARVWERAGRTLMPTSRRRRTDIDGQVLDRLADILGPTSGRGR